MRKTLAVCSKQIKDTWRNKSVLIQFALLPILALIMGYLMPEEVGAGPTLAPMFTTMYVGMVPLSCMTAIIAEEREKGTLRSLRMANVTGGQYLLGIGSCLFVESLFGISLFAILGGYTGAALAEHFMISMLGVLVSLMLGSTVGLLAKNQMSATSLSTPIAVVLSFVPTLATLNDSMAKVSRFLYTQQLQNMMQSIGNDPFTWKQLGIVGANLAVFCLLFLVIYKKKGLRDQ